MRPYVAAIDQGTTSTRFMIFDRSGHVIAAHQLEHAQIYPQPGWVEHDPLEIWERTMQVIPGAMRKAGVTASELAAIGITNQRETTVVWDKRTGRPYHNALVWQDTRTDRLCNELAQEGGQGRFRAQTGLPLATYFSGPKLMWLLEHVKGLREAAENGEALFGTIDTWLIWNLTGGPDSGAHITDVTNASRTMLMNLRTLDWDPDILRAMDIPPAMLPQIRPSSDPTPYGLTNPGGPVGGAVPVCGNLGDQQAALYGQTCFSPGEAKNTYGTGSFLLLNAGQEIVTSQHGLLTTLAYQIGGQAPVYALEGSIAIVGMTRYIHKGHLARAALEATAYQTREVIEAMKADSGVMLTALKVDGGMTVNETLMQFQADILDAPVVRPTVAETTSLGAAYAAGLAAGFWSGEEELRANWEIAREWRPAMPASQRERLYAGWKKAVTRTFDWVD